MAGFYYAPGWWEGSAGITAPVSLPAWNALPEHFKIAFETACNEQMMMMLAKYDARNPDALRRMIGEGTQLRLFPRPVLDACYKASFETFDELSAKDADFRTIYGPWKRFLEAPTHGSEWRNKASTLIASRTTSHHPHDERRA